MGDLVQQAVTSAVLAVGVFAVLTVAISWANTRFRAVRPLTHGTPVVIVEHGQPITATMQREHVSLDDLMSAAREQGLQRFADIGIAVLQTNGRISFFTTDRPDSGAPDPPQLG